MVSMGGQAWIRYPFVAYFAERISSTGWGTYAILENHALFSNSSTDASSRLKTETSIPLLSSIFLIFCGFIFMNITIYTSFSDAKDVWKKFEESGYYYAFQSYDWLHQWYRSFGTPSVQLCFVLIEKSAGKPILFLPFCIQEKCGIKMC